MIDTSYGHTCGANLTTCEATKMEVAPLDLSHDGDYNGLVLSVPGSIFASRLLRPRYPSHTNGMRISNAKGAATPPELLASRTHSALYHAGFC